MKRPIVREDATFYNADTTTLGDQAETLRHVLSRALSTLMYQKIAAQINATDYERSDGYQDYRTGK